MTSLWTFIILALFVQEPATTDAALFQARQHHLSLWLIHGIWVLATVIDIHLGYKFGQWIQQKFAGKKFTALSNRWADKVQNLIGRKGEQFALILLGIINFPYVNSFLGSWLKLNYKRIFVLLFIGDAIWYATEWGINLGLRRLIPNPHLALYIIVATGLLLGLLYKTILKKLLKNN